MPVCPYRQGKPSAQAIGARNHRRVRISSPATKSLRDHGHTSPAARAALPGAGTGTLGGGVQRLMAASRAGRVRPARVITSRIAAAAYAAYRMPATSAATAAALREMRLSLPGWAPSSLIDFGAGTGGSPRGGASGPPRVRGANLPAQSPHAATLATPVVTH